MDGLHLETSPGDVLVGPGEVLDGSHLSSLLGCIEQLDEEAGLSRFHPSDGTLLSPDVGVSGNSADWLVIWHT